MQRRWLSTIAAAAAVVLVVSACGSGDSASSSKIIGEIVIASELPSTEGKTIRVGSGGLPVQNGVQFAVSQVPSYKGYKFTFVGFDDAVKGVHDPKKGAENVDIALSDPRVLAMVGPFNANVARQAIPAANKGDLAMISMANSSECLTLEFAYCTPTAASLRPTGRNNYFRTPANNLYQGPAMADYFTKTLKVTKVAVFTDKDATFSMPITEGFVKRLQANGGTVTNRVDFDMKTAKDFTTFLKEAKAAGAQAIYAGAQSAAGNACVVRAQMKGIFDPATTPFGGYDLTGDEKCIKDAGDQAANMYFTNGIGDPTQNPTPEATKAIAEFKKAYPNPDDFGPYTMLAYDTTMIAIDAVKRAIDANAGKKPTRQQVVDAMATTNYKGLAATTYSFDAKGDPKAPLIQIQGTKGTPLDWTFISQSVATL